MDALAESSDTACVGAFGHPAFLNESHFINCARAFEFYLSTSSISHLTTSSSPAAKIISGAHKIIAGTNGLSRAGPLFLSCAETDITFPAPARHRAEELLTSSKYKDKGLKFHIQLFSGVEHGFALRGNMEDAYERFTKEESAAGIVRWFTRFM
ncbi:hypothetical protein FB451DRAFT_1227875 [Mycena latifolia]|nr:hypothetical protein FB451DRAFT_1227875 [Mycena latifolia]